MPDARRPQLDPARIAMLRGLGHGTLLPRLAATYRQQAILLIQATEAAAHAGDMQALQSAAHTLKSASFSIGANPLGELCHSIESVARGRATGDLAALLADLRPCHAALLAELDALP